MTDSRAPSLIATAADDDYHFHPEMSAPGGVLSSFKNFAAQERKRIALRLSRSDLTGSPIQHADGTGDFRYSRGQSDEDDRMSDSGYHVPDTTRPIARVTTPRYSNQPTLPRLEILDQSTSSKPDNFRVSPATSLPNWDESTTWKAVNDESARYREDALADISEQSLGLTGTTIESDLEDVLANWSGRGPHVDFQSHEEVPLVQGRFLGHGSMGSVFETSVKGYTFAWKRRFCRRRIGEAERKEIEILKKVSHHHIIKLAGSYTHRQFLGLLLYPVATCDLATFLEDSEAILTSTSRDPTREERMMTLGLLHKTSERTEFYGDRLLLARMGCIISAVEYLHSQSIRHKDLKPSNILLSVYNLWLTDFGTATDFSEQTVSTTENGERGTPKYFAPEMAAYEGTGRPADIFSLGCVLLEMHAIQQGQGLETLRNLRSKHDKSFQANLDTIHDWLSRPAEWDILCDHQIKDQIRRMLAREPAKRPTIGHVKEMFALIDTFQEQSGNAPLFGLCCRSLFVSREKHIRHLEIARIDTEKRVRVDTQKVLDETRTERDALQKRVIELQQTVDQKMWHLNAWVQRDALRLNEEAQMSDVRDGSRSGQLPASTARTSKKQQPAPTDSSSQPPPSTHFCRTCRAFSNSVEEFKRHTQSELDKVGELGAGTGPVPLIEWKHRSSMKLNWGYA